jgi:hypothetical protein
MKPRSNATSFLKVDLPRIPEIDRPGADGKSVRRAARQQRARWLVKTEFAVDGTTRTVLD